MSNKEFKDTLLHTVLTIPHDYGQGNCLYYCALALPFLTCLMVVGIPLAIAIDLCIASSRAK
jgi:hypothetical protein